MYRHSSTLRVLTRVAFVITTLLGGMSSAGATPPLHMPWTCGRTHPVSQSHQTGSHTGKGAWSWDFAMPVGTPLVAPADGTVRKLRQDSTRHGCNSSYAYDANYVVIAFGDGTEALFLHLQANSVPVEVGEHVSAGDVIGHSGLTGWTCGPHLHFQVQKTCTSWWCSSIPADFATFGDPDTGQRISSANCRQPSPPAQHASPSTPADQKATGGGARACFPK